MKRRYLYFIMITIMSGLLMAGCGSKSKESDLSAMLDKTEEKAEEETEDKKEDKEEKETKKKPKKEKKKSDADEEEKAEESIDHEAVYQPVFDEIFEIIDYGYNMDREYTYASNGLVDKIETARNEGNMDEIGYRYEDVSGDGIPELLIGYNADYLQNGGESYILNLFTIKDDKPYTTYAGHWRSGYQRYNDSQFFFTGSGGMSFVQMGLNHLSKDGTEIEWDDFYFTDEKEDREIGIYYNKTGTAEAKEAEELAISMDDYYEIMDDLAYNCKTFGWTSLLSLRDTEDVSGGKSGREEPFGKEIKIDAATQKKMNIFMSNFSEAYLTEYDKDNPDDYSLFWWAYLWTKLNKRDIITYEEHTLGDSNQTCEKINLKDISSVTEKYLDLKFTDDMAGRVIAESDDWRSCDYDRGFFYVPAADGEAYTSFTIVSKAEDLGGNKLKLNYTVYAQELDAYFDGKEINYGMTDEEAAKDKDTEDEPLRKGYAIVSVSGSSYKLEYLE